MPGATSFPTTQTALRIHNKGGQLSLDHDAPLPTLGEYDVLIRNRFSGINFVEIYYRTGFYTAAKYPFTLGREGSGEVVKTGAKVETFGVGDRVVYITNGGAHAQFTAVDSREKVVKIPNFISEKDSAASLFQGLTAITLVKESYQVKKGDWVLVHAAAGGTGSLVVQMAAAVGANVIGITSTKDKFGIVTANGAKHAISYKTEDVVARVMEITGGKGVDAVYDSVGNTSYESSMGSLARLGTFVSYGNSSGAIDPISIEDLKTKSVKVLRHSLSNYIYTPEEWVKYTSMYWTALAHNELKVNVTKVYPLSDTIEALDDLESGTTTGKLLIRT